MAGQTRLCDWCQTRKPLSLFGFRAHTRKRDGCCLECRSTAVPRGNRGALERKHAQQQLARLGRLA